MVHDAKRRRGAARLVRSVKTYAEAYRGNDWSRYDLGQVVEGKVATHHHLGLVVFLGLQMPSIKKTPSRKAEGFTMPK